MNILINMHLGWGWGWGGEEVTLELKGQQGTERCRYNEEQASRVHSGKDWQLNWSGAAVKEQRDHRKG